MEAAPIFSQPISFIERFGKIQAILVVHLRGKCININFALGNGHFERVKSTKIPFITGFRVYGTTSKMSTEKSQQLFKEAQKYFPGGVNSPVRAFKSVGGTPLFIDRGEGCRIWDSDDNSYVDFCCSWGPLILGHANPSVIKSLEKVIAKGTSFGAPTKLENELGRLILENNSYIEALRLVNSGTEAVMSAIRLARVATGRDKVIKFDGCYHGHADAMLVKAGSGLATFGVSSSSGVPEGSSNDTIVLELGDREGIDLAFKNFSNEIACIILEPVPANNGLLIQDKEFLLFLKEICTRYGALLIFDEVISGFRLGFEGAAGWYGIQPDIITYGKIIGGGMPVGAYGGSKEIMQHISPAGGVYQAGTLSGNPAAMAAGIAQLTACLEPSFYDTLNHKADKFYEIIRQYIASKGHQVQLNSMGSIFWFAFGPPKDYLKASDINPETMDTFKVFYKHLLDGGVYFGPSGYEVGFVSSAHELSDLQQAADAICHALDQTS
jgi:glutamate-1-semialdehyde 2,1-aminomutase